MAAKVPKTSPPSIYVAYGALVYELLTHRVAEYRSALVLRKLPNRGTDLQLVILTPLEELLVRKDVDPFRDTLLFRTRGAGSCLRHLNTLPSTGIKREQSALSALFH